MATSFAPRARQSDQIGYMNSGASYENNPNDPLGYVNPSAQYMNPTNYGTGSNPSSLLPSYGNDSGLLSNLGSLASGAGSAINGILGSNLGQLGLYTGLYTLISGQAQNAQKENNALAGQITDIGKPAVGESQSLLGAYGAGTLTQPFQTQMDAAIQNNANAAATQKAQSARLLDNASGGQNLSGALASQFQQITNRQAQLNTEAVSNAFAGELAASNSLLAAGGPYVQTGIQQEIQSNTQLQSQLSQLMGALASAYAQSVSGSKGSGQGSGNKPSVSAGSGNGGGGGGGSGGGGGGGSGYQPYGDRPQNGYTYSQPYTQPNGANGNYGYYTGGGDPFAGLGLAYY